MQFDLPKEKSSIIKVIGIGGCGSNAVNNMFNKGIEGVNFVVCNTDSQALDLSPVPNRIQLGIHLTEGCGAGSVPEKGRQSTEESEEEIKEILNANTKMVFITAGMGGGTGTGGAPVIAKLAREMDILTVAIITLPLLSEGPRKTKQAKEGLEELRKYADAVIVISNDKMCNIYTDLSLEEAFEKADEVLLSAAKGIAEIITIPGQINVDFQDVKYVMNDSGVAIIGMASAEGEHRALRAVEGALSSPLLNDSDIRGASNILLNITSGTKGIKVSEINEIMGRITEETGATDIIWGNCKDERLDEKINVTIIATGFKSNEMDSDNELNSNKKVIRHLEPDTLPEEAKNQAEKTSDIELKVNEDNDLKKQTKKTEQTTFEFNLNPNKDFQPVIPDNNELINKSAGENDIDNDMPNKMQDRQINDTERKERLRKFSLDLQDPQNIDHLESEPAFKRNNIEFIKPVHSSEQSYSRYTLGLNEDGTGANKKIELRKNNSFLHDNVD